MLKRTTIAILGAGRWGTHLVRNFLAHPQAQVVAVIDPNLERLTELAQRLDLGQDVILATDWTAVPLPPLVEAVAIATPAITHYSLIKRALEQGYHVLAEKPLTLDLSESFALCRLAEQQQRQLLVDHTYLFHAAVRLGEQVVQAGTLGDLRYGYASRTHLGPIRQDVDALWDLAIHDIAIFSTWLGQMPEQVQAHGTVWLQATAPTPSVFPQGLADLVWVILTYPNGFQAFIHLCWLNPDKQRRLSLAGNLATLVFDELSPTAPLTIQYGHLEQATQPESSPSSQASTVAYLPVHQTAQILHLDPIEPLQQVCDHFLSCIDSNAPSPISSGWVGARLVKVLTALTDSLNRAGQPIKLTWESNESP